MSAIQQLDDALQERNTKTNAFLEEIISIINASVESLPFCTRANSTPEVAGSVKVLRSELDKIITKIKDNSNIDEHAARGLVNRLKLSNLKKRDSGLTPRSSELDDARFSADETPRSSTGSDYGTPRSSTGSDYGTPRSSTGSDGPTRQVYPIVQPDANGHYNFDQPRGGKRTRRR